MLVDTLLQRLREFFVDVTDANVVFHLGDLFDPSQFRLRDVFLKTELINALHLPFELTAGYLGDVRVEGFVGFVAGSPITIAVDNVCLVLAHKPVDWNNEVALRYAKELLLAILQSVAPASSSAKPKAKDKSEGSSDVLKWLLGKIQTTIAETTVKLDRLHVRFESEHEGQLIAYGVHIPTVQLSTRDLDDQILSRRQQLGVTYPVVSNDNTASKRLYLGNVSVYCDLEATSFWGPSPPKPPPTTPRSATAPSVPSPVLTLEERMDFMRQQCQTPFTPSAERDLVLISALWLKLDFVRDTKAASSLASWGLGAVDIVTEDIRINGDFTQLAAITDELATVADFFQREQRHAWRPSHVDRDRVAPLTATLSTTTLLPVVSPDVIRQLSTTSNPPRCFNRAWLRGMWRYAAYCVLVEARNGDARRVRLGRVDESEQQVEGDRARYLTLYTRSLSDESLKIMLFGRTLVPSSPRATETRRKQQAAVPLPVYEPLTMAEQWELSDLVARLPIRGQRVWRQAVAQRVRVDYASHQSPRPGPARELSIEIPMDTADVSPTRRTSGASISPGYSPTHQSPAFLNGSVQLPPDFVANHHHHYTRSRAESSPAGSPTKLDNVSPPSPIHSASSHPHLTHSASAPMTHKKASPQTNYSFRALPSPTNASRHEWFVESFLPSWLLRPSRVIPLINWHIGPLSVRLHHRTPAADTTTVFAPPSVALSSIPPRSEETFMEFHVDGCTGCILLCKVPNVSFLVELRLGLVRVALVDLASTSTTKNGATGNSITTDYIRDPTDGFVYVGLKYNFKHATALDEDLWDLKAKVCVGTVHIEYNDMALKTAMRTDGTRRPSLSKSFLHDTSVLSPPSIRLDSASYVTIIQDVLSNWKTFLQRVQPADMPSSPSLDVFKDSQEAERKQLKRAATQARVSKLLNALMLQSSCVDVDTSGMELQLSVLTSNVFESASKTNASPMSRLPSPMHLPLFDSEQVHVTLPSTNAGLQNRPLLNECQVHAGGARLKFRTTKHGRAAVIDHVLHRVFPPRKNEPVKQL